VTDATGAVDATGECPVAPVRATEEPEPIGLGLGSPPGEYKYAGSASHGYVTG